MKLSDLDAEIIDKTVNGLVHRCLLFKLRGGFYATPFDEQGRDMQVEQGGHSWRYLVWKRESGSTIDDLTLSPSYLVYETDPATGARVGERLHGWVRNGEWVDC